MKRVVGLRRDVTKALIMDGKAKSTESQIEAEQYLPEQLPALSTSS
jgi:hypothetical protein